MIKVSFAQSQGCFCHIRSIQLLMNGAAVSKIQESGNKLLAMNPNINPAFNCVGYALLHISFSATNKWHEGRDPYTGLWLAKNEGMDLFSSSYITH